MSMITRCTACETMFRVVPDQLRISDGWVRCGRCGEVFDGLANLVDAPSPDTQSLDTQSPDTQPVDSRPIAPPTGEALVPPSAPDEPPAAVAPPSPAAAEAAPRREQARSVEAGHPPDAGERDREVPTPRPEPVEAEPIAVLRPDPGGASLAAPASESSPDGMADEPTPSFMRARNRPTREPSRLGRALLGLAALALLILLGAQVLVHERDRLAAMEPRLRPLLAQACGWLGCRIDPPRQIGAVVIESSSFTRLRGDTYQLGFSLRNTARFEVAMPAIEVTVTDGQDQALARRVLLPDEFGPARTALAAGGDWNARLTLGVRTLAAERVAGYRVLAFYP